MPSFSFRRPIDWIRSHRSSSRSPKPSPADSLDDAVSDTSPSRIPDPSRFSLSRLWSRPQRDPGMFYQAKQTAMQQPIFFDSNKGTVKVTNNINNTIHNTQFMKDLLNETIPGAASDSSARDPPPKCLPETRLAILERCLYFIANCNGEKQTRWVVGAAGVGKSAIMQSVIDSPDLQVACHVSIFFSVQGRDDGTKAITTLCYQFAVKSDLYRQVIEYEVSRDPSLLKSSMQVQFQKFIVEPFIYHPSLKSAGRILIIVDGLDECKNTHTQLELLRLISDFCVTHPSSHLVWLIASRPEQHITSFFERAEVRPAYEKEEIAVDSAEARADVKLFLRHELKAIVQEASDSLDSGWPKEADFQKLARAAGGLFAYAHAVIRYIGDEDVGNPVAQLSDVLTVIDKHPMAGIQSQEHPMALLDALYARILGKIPQKNMEYARKLLLALASGWDSVLCSPGEASFVVLCNWLGMTRDEAYAAIKQLQSTLLVPRRDKSHEEKLKPFHKSFTDYISDYTRSKFSSDIQREAQQLKAECAFRIFREVSDGIDSGEADYKLVYGNLRRGSGTSDQIPLTWWIDEAVGWDNKKTRLSLYKLAVGEVVQGVRRSDPTFETVSCVRLLATQFEQYDAQFPFYEFGDLLLNESRHLMHNVSGKIPVKAVDLSLISRAVKLQLHPRATGATDSFDAWNSSCKHEQISKKKGGEDHGWETTFELYSESGNSGCTFCTGQLEDLLESQTTEESDHAMPIMSTSAGECCVELRFVDLDDDKMEWTYRFWYSLSPEKCKGYESAV